MVETSLVNKHVAVLSSVEIQLNTMAKLPWMEAYLSQGSLSSRIPLFCSPISQKKKKEKKKKKRKEKERKKKKVLGTNVQGPMS